MIYNKHHFEKWIVFLPSFKPLKNPFLLPLWTSLPHPWKLTISKVEKHWKQEPSGKGLSWTPSSVHEVLLWHTPMCSAVNPETAPFPLPWSKQNHKQRDAGRREVNLPPLNLNGFLWGRAWEHCEEKQRHTAALMSVASDRKLQMVHYLEKNSFNKRMHSYIFFHNKNPNMTFCSQA